MSDDGSVLPRREKASSSGVAMDAAHLIDDRSKVIAKEDVGYNSNMES